MTRLLVHVEGQTEEQFVNEVLAPHLFAMGYTSVSSRRMGSARQRSKRQGVKPWLDVKKELGNILREDSASYATLMVDYYGMPDATWPGREKANTIAHKDKAEHIQNELHRDLQNDEPNLARRFIPFVLMHEFEALLFSDCSGFARGIDEQRIEENLLSIRNQFDSPEHINDSKVTAPSKRILSLMPKYSKPLHGNLAALEIGLVAMRKECHGFNQWLTKLEVIGASAQ
jgi:Domain of unknown function (DUF4276)